MFISKNEYVLLLVFQLW